MADPITELLHNVQYVLNTYQPFFVALQFFYLLAVFLTHNTRLTLKSIISQPLRCVCVWS